MKKIMYFVPAIVLTIDVIALNSILGEPSPRWYLWISLLWISGILLSKDKVWGSLPGLTLTIYLIILGTQYTGQVINIESPLGIIMTIYYIICSAYVWKSKKKTN